MTLGQRIRAARLQQRLTQEQLAGEDFSKSYVSALERGDRAPRLPTLKLIARRLNRPLSYFMDGVTEDREREAFLVIGLAHLRAQSLTEAAAWLKRALDATRDDADELLQARIDLALACVDQRLGRDLRAWRRAEGVLHALARHGDRRLLIRAQLCLGRSKLAGGEPASAAWTFEAALQLLASPETDPSPGAALYYYLGVARKRMGQIAEAMEAFRKALKVAEPFSDSQNVGAWQLDRAAEAAEKGAFEVAIARAGEAIAIYDMVDYKRQLAEVYWQLGDLEACAERWIEAQRHYSRSIVLYGAARHVRGAAHALGYFFEVLHARAPSEAVRLIAETVLALFPDEGDAACATQENRASTLWLRGTVQRLLGRRDAARASLAESLRLFERLQWAEEIKHVRRELVLLAVESNDLVGARGYLTSLSETAQVYDITPVL